MKFIKVLAILITLIIVIFAVSVFTGILNLIGGYKTIRSMENGDISTMRELYEINSDKDLKKVIENHHDTNIKLLKVLNLDNRKVVFFYDNLSDKFGHTLFTRVENNKYSYNLSTIGPKDDTKLFRVETTKEVYIIIGKNNEKFKIKDMEIIIPHPENNKKDLRYEYDVRDKSVIIKAIKVPKTYLSEIKKIVYLFYDESNNNIW